MNEQKVPTGWYWAHVSTKDGSVIGEGMSKDEVEPTPDTLMDGGSVATIVAQVTIH